MWCFGLSPVVHMVLSDILPPIKLRPSLILLHLLPCPVLSYELSLMCATPPSPFKLCPSPIPTYCTCFCFSMQLRYLHLFSLTPPSNHSNFTLPWYWYMYPYSLDPTLLYSQPFTPPPPPHPSLYQSN